MMSFLKVRIDARILLLGIIILQVVILIYGGWGCGDTEEITPDKAGESVFALPKVALGTFTGEESGYSLEVGRNQVKVPASKWLLRLNNATIYLKQYSTTASFEYEGPFLVELEDDTLLTIIAKLSERKTQTVYTPRLRYKKNDNVWLLENRSSEQGVTLIKR